MISGESAETPVDTIRASGVRPSSRALASRHDHYRGGAVVERAAVAGRDRAVRAEHRLQPVDGLKVTPARGPSSFCHACRPAGSPA